VIYDWKMELYWRLPVSIQEAALSIYAGHLEKLYYGNGYGCWQQKFIEWRRWSRAEAESWQSQQLQSLVELAATGIPYYKKRWQRLDWKSVRSRDDLHVLPLVDKQSVRENAQEFLVEGLNPRSLWVEKTSGSTGTALRIYWPMSMLPKWWAATEVLIRNVAGVAQDLPRATMSGRSIVRGETTKPPYWRFNRRWRQLYLSSYHVSRDTASSYVQAIGKYGSRWITGYGSAIAALAESALDKGLPPVPLQAAIVSGDTLLPSQRSSIEQFFQCRCFDAYGQCEGVTAAMECRHGRMHVIPAIGILEILREDGSPCRPGEIGEMVATGLLNDAMPLIRYRLGDYAAFAEVQDCPCGNPQPIIANLEGRVDDYLITSSGRKIGRLAGFRRSPNIHSAQLVQDSFSHAFLLVRPGRNYGSKDALAVRDDIVSRVGDLPIEIVEVTDIPKTRQGKAVSVVRLMDRPDTRPIYKEVLERRQCSVVHRRSECEEGNSPSQATPSLKHMNVVIMTSGHDVTDSRIYTKLACSIAKMQANVTLVGKLEGRDPGQVKMLTVAKPSSRLTRFLWQPWRCMWAARRLPADIVHFHDAEMLMTLPVAKLWWPRAKFVYDVHEDFANLMLIRDWLPSWAKPIVRLVTDVAEKALALMADGIVGVTPPLADKFPNKKKIVAYNYVSRRFFERAAKLLNEPQRRRFDLVHLGTLSLRRAKFLADTIREFHRLRPNARSLVIGIPPEMEKILQDRVPDNCILIGKTPHEEIPAFLADSKVGLDVHPWLGPHLEVALPVKVCEYTAAGCAVVSSSMPVLDQLISEMKADSDTVKIIKSERPDDYARAAVQLIEAIEKGVDPGEKLRQSALKHLVWEKEAAKIAEFYLSLLGRTCGT
jgi:phenylacetate-CoA ligase